MSVYEYRGLNAKGKQVKGLKEADTKKSLRALLRKEGIMALYKGFVPTFVRQAPFVMVTFITLEQVKRFWKYLDGDNV